MKTINQSPYESRRQAWRCCGMRPTWPWLRWWPASVGVLPSCTMHHAPHAAAPCHRQMRSRGPLGPQAAVLVVWRPLDAKGGIPDTLSLLHRSQHHVALLLVGPKLDALDGACTTGAPWAIRERLSEAADTHGWMMPLRRSSWSRGDDVEHVRRCVCNAGAGRVGIHWPPSGDQVMCCYVSTRTGARMMARACNTCVHKE